MSEAAARRKLKITILLDKFLPSRGGERYFSMLAEELVRRGHEVHLFASKVEEGPKTPYEVHLVPIIGFPRSLRMLSYMFSSARILKRFDFDVVHGLGQTLVSNVLNPHGGVERAYLKQEFASITSRWYYVYRWIRRHASLRHYLELWAQRRLYSGKHVKRVIAISEMVKKDIIDYFDFPGEKIAVVFNSVDLRRFHPSVRERFREAKRKELHIADNSILLLFAGNNYRLKGLEPLLRALSLLRAKPGARPVHLVVLGRSRIGRYRKMAERLGVADRVFFLGAASSMEPYYGAADIYVHPTFYDSCSLTVLEALACGLPAITSRFNGASDAIRSDDGGKIIYDPSDAQEIADAVIYYFDEERRKKARLVARTWMEDYPPTRNVEETLAVYYHVAAPVKA